MKSRILIAAIVASTLSAPLMAADNSGLFYAGGLVGGVWHDLEDAEDSLDQAARSASALPGVTASYSVDDVEMQYGAQIGYQINRFFAIELAYRDYGDPDTDFQASGGANQIVSESDISVSGIGLGLLGFIPIGETFNLFARIDAVSLRSRIETTEIDTTGTPIFTRTSSKDNDIKLGYGVGVQFNYETCTSFRIEANLVEAGIPAVTQLNDWDVIGLSFGLMKSF